MDKAFAASAADVAVDGVEYQAEIARSGSALVYRGWQAGEKRHVAVKVLGLTQVPAGALDAATSLPSHPHIIEVHESGVNAAGHPFLVMDYLDGGSMAERIERDGPLAWPEAIRAGIKLAVALDAAHQARLLHLGIKPSNVLLTGDGDVRLGDFVTTELRRRSSSAPPAVTFGFVAPEVLAGTKASRASDIFSLAATISALITGEPPARVGQAATAELRRRQVPAALAQVVGQALAEDPGERPPSARAFARALRDAATAASTDDQRTEASRPATPAGTPQAVEPDDQVEGSAPADRRRQLVGGAFLVLVIAVVAYLLLRQPSAPQADDPAGGQPAPQVVEGGAVGQTARGDLALFGIEGEVTIGSDVSLPGLEVRSVAASSAAEAAGVAVGDLITRIAGIHLAGDDTAGYESAVGDANPETALSIQLLRPSERVVYAGELSGTPLAPVIDRTLLPDLPVGEEPLNAFVEILDETGALKVAAPASWTEIDVRAFVDLGPNIQAAPNLSDFRGGWSSPGLNLTATTERDVNDLEGIMASFIEPGGLADCATGGPQPYADGAWSGLVQYFTDCGGTSTGFVQVVATPDDQAFVVQLGVQLVDQDDFSALSAALASARVVGSL